MINPTAEHLPMNKLAPTVLIVAATSMNPVAHADDKDVIEYREHIMTTLNEQSAALGEILSTTVPPDNTVAHIDAIALTASIALKAFEPKVPGGEAKPEVWARWADFSKRMTELAQRTSQLAKLAREQGRDAALVDVTAALTCKGCHDEYRKEKKSQDAK